MKNVVLLTVGAGVGFLAAHELNKTSQGRQFFENVRAKTNEFTHALVDGYRTRESELRTASNGSAADDTDSAHTAELANTADALTSR